MEIDYGVSRSRSSSCADATKIASFVTLCVFTFIAFVLGAYSASAVRAVKKTIDDNPSLTLNARKKGKQSVSLYRGEGSWHDQKPLAKATSDLQAVTGLHGIIYLFGGFNEDNVTLNTITAYDVVRQTYTAKTNLTSPRSQFGAGAFTDATSGAVTKIIVAGGLSDVTAYPVPALLTSEIYTIASNSVAAGPNLSEQHLDGCMASTGDAVYMIGGWKDNYGTPSKTVEKLTRSGSSWTTVASLPEARGDCSAAALDGKIYVVAGYYSPEWDASKGFKNTAFMYDPAKDVWTTVAPLSYARGDLQLVATDNSIVAIGGETYFSRNGGHADKIATHYVEEYLPDQDAWESRALLGTGRFRFAATSSHWGIHVFGGSEVCAEPASSSDFTSCYTYQTDSHEVYFELEHPDIWVNYN